MLAGRMLVSQMDRISIRLARCEQRWSLTVGNPFTRTPYSYVAPAIRADGTAVVVKLGLNLRCEIEALRFWDGRGSVRMLDADLEKGLLILEHLRPGTPLSRVVDDRQAISIAVQVMRQLWRPVPAVHNFPSI